MTEEPARLILELLRQMRAELGDVRSEMATKTDLESVRSEVADIKSNIHRDHRSPRARVFHNCAEVSAVVEGRVAG